MVGDSFDNDVVAAQHAGLQTAWFAPAGAVPPAELPRPDYILGALGELESIV